MVHISTEELTSVINNTFDDDKYELVDSLKRLIKRETDNDWEWELIQRKL